MAGSVALQKNTVGSRGDRRKIPLDVPLRTRERAKEPPLDLGHFTDETREGRHRGRAQGRGGIWVDGSVSVSPFCRNPVSGKRRKALFRLRICIVPEGLQ